MATEVIAGREVHPLAAAFPLLAGVALAALVADIKQHGLRRPILVDGRGRVIDGRNRLRACVEAGVTPRFEVCEIDEDEVLALIISENVHRRHLTPAQLAMVAANVVQARRAQGRAEGRSSHVVGEQFGLSARTIEEALAVLDRGAEGLAALVIGGEVGVSVAAALARENDTTQRRVVQQGPDAVREHARNQRAARADLRAARAASADSGRDRAAAEASAAVADGRESVDRTAASAPTPAVAGEQHAAFDDAGGWRDGGRVRWVTQQGKVIVAPIVTVPGSGPLDPPTTATWGGHLELDASGAVVRLEPVDRQLAELRVKWRLTN